MSMIMHGLEWYEALNGWIAFLKRVEIWNFHNEYGESEDFATSCKEKAGI